MELPNSRGSARLVILSAAKDPTTLFRPLYIDPQIVIVRSLTPKEFGVRDDGVAGGVRSQNSRPRFSGPIAASRMIARKTKHSTNAIVRA